MIARERGLEPLAMAVFDASLRRDPQEMAATFVDAEKESQISRQQFRARRTSLPN